MRRVSSFLGLLVFSFALHGSAQTTAGGHRAAAEALFNQGRDLMAAGRFAEACPKFEASQELDPGLGTMLNLAECYEKTGRTASAWAQYREAIPLARAAGSKTRQDLASERAQALHERLSTLTIRAMNGDADSVQLEVRRDGVPVRAAELGSPIPVDPGDHLIEAVAPGKQPWSSKVRVGSDAAKVEVDIPLLQPQAVAPASAPTPVAVAGPDHADAGADRPGTARRTAGLIAGGAGIVGLGLGAYFGLKASGDWSDAKAECASFPYECGAKGQDLTSSARSGATISNVGFIAGGVLLGAGMVLYFTAPSKKASVALSVGPASAVVRGSFQ